MVLKKFMAEFWSTRIDTYQEARMAWSERGMWMVDGGRWACEPRELPLCHRYGADELLIKAANSQVAVPGARQMQQARQIEL